MRWIVRWIVSGLAVALALSAPAVIAQTTSPNVSNAPSAKNSGAGIAGEPGDKNGPAVRPGPKGTVGSSVNRQHNLKVQEQDPSDIKGMRGDKSGPRAKPNY